jgi:hypothetical protein
VTWTALGDEDLRFSVLLVTNANAVEGRITSPTRLYHQHNQSTHMSDGVTVMSVSASLQQKTRVAMDHVCQILLNQKLLHIIYAKLH